MLTLVHGLWSLVEPLTNLVYTFCSLLWIIGSVGFDIFWNRTGDLYRVLPDLIEYWFSMNFIDCLFSLISY